MAPTRKRKGSRRRSKSSGENRSGKRRDGVTGEELVAEMRRCDEEAAARFYALDTSEEGRGFVGDGPPTAALALLTLLGDGRNPHPKSPDLDPRERAAVEALAAHADLLRAWLAGSCRAWDHALARWSKAIAQVARPPEAAKLSKADSVKFGLLEQSDPPRFLRGLRDGDRLDVEVSWEGELPVPGRPRDDATREAAQRMRPLLTRIRQYSAAQSQRNAGAAEGALAGLSAEEAGLIRDAGESVDRCTATAGLARPSAMLVLVVQQDVEQRTGRRPSVEIVRRSLWRRG